MSGKENFVLMLSSGRPDPVLTEFGPLNVSQCIPLVSGEQHCLLAPNRDMDRCVALAEVLFLLANFARRSINLAVVDLHLIVPFFAMDMRVSADFGPSWTAELLPLLGRASGFSVTIRSTVPIVQNKVFVQNGASPSGAALIISFRRAAKSPQQ